MNLFNTISCAGLAVVLMKKFLPSSVLHTRSRKTIRDILDICGLYVDPPHYSLCMF